jgi:hypothetical protein
MKKYLVILYVLLSLGCKKNKESVPGDLALSKQYMNNILISERTYTADGKVAKEQSYDEQTGAVGYAIEYEYDSYGRLLKEKQYDPAKKPSGIVSYYWKSNGRLEKHELLTMSGADSGKITIRVKYTYDAEGRIAKQSWVDLLTDKVDNSREMNYYDNNNLKSVVGYYYYGGPAELKYRVDYLPEGDTLPPGLTNRGGYIIDFRLPDFVADKMYYKYYDDALVTTEMNTLYTNRQYNERGYLKSQKVTLKKIKPANPDEVNEYRYEYIEL